MPVDLSFSGLASNFDWKTFVSSIMATQNAPIDRIKAAQAANARKVSALGALQSSLTTLQGAATALAAPDLFAGRSVASTTASSTWSAQAGIGTAKGSYQIAVSELAAAARLRGALDRGSALHTGTDVSGLTIATLPVATAVTAGTFTVNGQQVTVALTDSLSQVFTAISTATGGAVTAGYSNTTDQITLSSASEIILGAANDTSNFLSAMKLANNGTGAVASSGQLGVLDPAATVANARLKTAITAVDGSGNGSFTINGTTISYNVNTDALGAILTRINQSAAGVTAAYDAAGDRVTLTNNVTGDIGLTVSETAGGLLGALGLTPAGGGTLARGVNAQFTVNGGATRSSTANALTESALGVPGLSVTVTAKETQTLNVAANTAAMSTAINKFLQGYNELQGTLDSLTSITSANGAVTAAVLASNREVQEWGSSLRTKVFAAVPGLTGAVKRLSDLGIDFTPGTSQLDIADPAKLNAALANTPDDVAAFFQTASTGLSGQFSSYIAKLLTDDTTQQAAITQANKDLDTQIAAIQRRLDQQRALLTASFVAMEKAQALIRNQQQALNSAFNLNSSSGNSGTTGRLSNG
ncbi:MAG: flagellar filament capping protein FliD [Opitutae bacterium]|nr:flagellar filament capping protein FliD [Opitutae bacterium]